MSIGNAALHQSETRTAAPFSPLGEKEHMERQAAARLRRSPYSEVRSVACEFHEGLLRLRGRVSSFYLKQVAQTAVMDLDGVEEIHNHLEVVSPPDCP
jgi:osmotically-inducible protein OsmY